MPLPGAETGGPAEAGRTAERGRAALPLDHPLPGRPHRVYVALTNHCNRACPWCSTCSSHAGTAWMTRDAFLAALPTSGAFQVQLEGGEPTLHPLFFELVALARAEPRCDRVVVCTNGVVLPRDPARLRAWVERLGAPLTLKLSVNHHLLDRDPGLLALARTLMELFVSRSASRAGETPPSKAADSSRAPAAEPERLLVLNVRLRRGVEDDDRRVLDAVERAGLLSHANVFFLQRYGFASEEETWDPPRPVFDTFTLVNPDGAAFGPDLVARSEAMRRLG